MKAIVELSNREIVEIDLPDPVVERKINFGYSCQPGELSTIRSLGFKDPKVIRVFDSDAVLNIPSSMYSSAYTSWISWKPSQFTTATWGNQVETYVRANISKNVKVLITAHHEPENNAGSGQTLAEWASLWRQGITHITVACEKLRREGWDVWSAPVICDWVFEGWNGQSINLWYPLNGSLRADILGFDSYPQGQNAANKKNIARLQMTDNYVPAIYADPNRFDCYKSFRRTADHAAKFGKPWGIAEIGMVRGDRATDDTFYRYSLTQRADWFSLVTQDLLSLNYPPEWVTWYMDGGCYVNDQECVNAINASIR